MISCEGSWNLLHCMLFVKTEAEKKNVTRLDSQFSVLHHQSNVKNSEQPLEIDR